MPATKKRATNPLVAIGTNRPKVMRSIRHWMDAATAENIADGMEWYARAFDVATYVSEFADVSIERAAIAIAHLSPQLRWNKNVDAILSLVHTGHVTAVLGRSKNNAKWALGYAPFNMCPVWDTFGKGPKTFAFAKNILGFSDYVTIDVWACRVAGIDESKLGRKGVYDAISDCYRAVALEYGITPAQLQAITWVSIRPEDGK